MICYLLPDYWYGLVVCTKHFKNCFANCKMYLARMIVVEGSLLYIIYRHLSVSEFFLGPTVQMKILPDIWLPL